MEEVKGFVCGKSACVLGWEEGYLEGKQALSERSSARIQFYPQGNLNCRLGRRQHVESTGNPPPQALPLPKRQRQEGKEKRIWDYIYHPGNMSGFTSYIQPFSPLDLAKLFNKGRRPSGNAGQPPPPPGCSHSPLFPSLSPACSFLQQVL